MSEQESPRIAAPSSAALDTGLTCLVMLARFHQIAADPEQLAHQFKASAEGFGKPDILLAAKHLGLQAKVVKTSIDRLDRTPLPAMAVDKDGGYFILARFDADKALIHDPKAERPEIVSRDQLLARWSSELILFTSRASMIGEMAKFDFSWFIPAVVKYRKLLYEVLLVSFVLNLFALVPRCSSRS
jgi:subfamily B ATP-binding cassette protein HlyB/CyaB